jgi:hypothetical protein
LPTLILRGYGRTVSLDGPAGALAMARENLPSTYRVGIDPPERCWAVREHSDVGWAAMVGGHVLTYWGSIAEATEAVLSDLELWVAEFARKWVFVHAGCVAVDGQAVLLPGRSMTGKSGLTAALVRAGADYYSDEYAVLDNHGLVRPYARKPAVRPRDGGPAGRVTVDELGGAVGRGPARVELIAALRFDPGAGWQSESVARATGFLRLLDNAVAARSRPRAVLSALEGATLSARTLDGTRGSADDAAARLLSILSNSKRSTGTLTSTT